MRVRLVIALLGALILLLVVAWSQLGGGQVATPSATIEAPQDRVVVPAPMPAALRPPATPDVRAAEPTPSADSALRQPAEPRLTASDAEPHRDERPKLRIHVVDGFGAPVPTATVSAFAFRTKQNPGAHFGWRGEKPKAQTDKDGWAELEYQRWFKTKDGWEELAKATLNVVHPEYSTFSGDVDVQAGKALVTLERGAFLVVSGWIDEPEYVESGVQPHLEGPSGVGADDWLPLADGRPSCSKLSPGPHAIYLELEDNSGAMWFSRVETFDLEEGEQKELSLELIASRDLRGKLSENVPRPVFEGEVQLCLSVSGEAWMMRSYTATVAGDGSFLFEDLPPGAGQLLGLSNGWASRPDPDADQNASFQPWPVPEEPAQPFELPMQASATCVVTVLSPDGRPLRNAAVTTWPNARFGPVSTMFMNRSWTTRCDSNGLARLEDLPYGRNVGLAVTLAGWKMPQMAMPWNAKSKTRQAFATYLPGETTTLEIRMERDEE